MKLPRTGGRQAVDALLKIGFVIHRIRGSHYILKHEVNNCRVTIPYHRRELAPKTLLSILRQAGISVEEFIKLL